MFTRGNRSSVEMEQKFCDTLSKLRRKIDELSGCPLKSPSVTSASASVSAVNPKLPEITISPFNGNFLEWRAFFELFDNLIIKNCNLTDVQRFVYLKSYLRNEPLELVDSLRLTSDNFQIAIQTLQDRYEDEYRIINTHIKHLLEVPPLVKSSAADTRKFTTQAKQCIQSLENLNVSKEEWAELMLIHIYSQKLDFHTNKSFETDRDPKKRPTLQDFFNFQDKRCTVLETVS